MEDEFSALVQGVLTEAERLGLTDTSIKYYKSCCRKVVGFCRRREIDRLTEQSIVDFLSEMDARMACGEIGPPIRSTLEKTIRMMLEFQQTGSIAWKRRRPPSGLSTDADRLLQEFASFSRSTVAPGSIRILVAEIRQFLAYLEASGLSLGSITVDDVRGFFAAVRSRHTSGLGNTVWAIKRFFEFANQRELTHMRVDALLAKAGPRRVRALPCFTVEETSGLLTAIDTGTARGKRDYAMVWIALSTGLRCCDIVSLRLDGIDWRRDEIRLVQEKTSTPLTLPLSPETGNAIADWLLHARPACDAPEVFVRLRAPFVKLTGPTGAIVMGRWLGKAGVTHQAHDGKTFHALRRTTGTRLVESGAELALTAQVLGHASVDSSRRYIALADESLRVCCLPLDAFACTKDGL